MKKIFLLIFPALCCHCVMMIEDVKSLPVTDDFVGVWEQSSDCKVHEKMKGDVIIRKSPEKSGLLEVRWSHSKEFSAINGVGAFDYTDYENKNYRISLDAEVFKDGKILVSGTIWKRTEGDKKNLALIMKRYELTEKGELVYEKYGHTAYEDKGFQLKAYADWFPENYHCLMTRKKKKKPPSGTKT